MMEFRNATPDDCGILAAMRVEFLREVQDVHPGPRDDELTAHTARYFRDHTANGGFVSWLALDGAEIVGTGGMRLYDLPPKYDNPTGMNAYIMNIYVKPEYRRQGIGEKLFELVLNGARERGVTMVHLHATEAGAPLYRKFGFTPRVSEMMLNTYGKQVVPHNG
jgi:GNAT superfamily N-acetyltransferase